MVLAGASGIALAVAASHFLGKQLGVPPTMNKEGEATDDGTIIKKMTVDYEAIIRTGLAAKASFQTLMIMKEVLRDQLLETSIKYTPFPASTAHVRVKYNVEYAIGYILEPGTFSVTGGADGVVITLHRPRLISRPSVKLLSYSILESGILIDEKAALLELQQRIQPETERRAGEVLNRPDVIPRSEQVLREFLQTLLKRQGGTSPPITFRYR